VIPIYGWTRYNRINLEYKGQMVATIKGIDDVAADSAQTIQLMKALATYSSLMASDTTQSMLQDNENNTTSPELINKSIQREEADDNSNDQTNVPATNVAIAPKPAPVVITKPVVTKPVTAKPVPAKPIAKAKPASAKNVSTKVEKKKVTANPKEVMPKKKEETKVVTNKPKTTNEY
jgi:hypothetical protein